MLWTGHRTRRRYRHILFFQSNATLDMTSSGFDDLPLSHRVRDPERPSDAAMHTEDRGGK